MSYTPDTPAVVGRGGPLRALMPCPTGIAQAQAIAVIRPTADARLRYGAFSQAGLPEDDHALTLHFAPGIEARHGALGAVVDGEPTIATDVLRVWFPAEPSL